MLQERTQLPLSSSHDDILKAIEENSVVLIRGETGSGKTTQVGPSHFSLFVLFIFELWCWRRLLRIPSTARRITKSAIEEIKSTNPLEALIKKQQLSYFVISCEKNKKNHYVVNEWRYKKERQTTSTLAR